jgi:hypothetical protein
MVKLAVVDERGVKDFRFALLKTSRNYDGRDKWMGMLLLDSVMGSSTSSPWNLQVNPGSFSSPTVSYR